MKNWTQFYLEFIKGSWLKIRFILSLWKDKFYSKLQGFFSRWTDWGMIKKIYIKCKNAYYLWTTDLHCVIIGAYQNTITYIVLWNLYSLNVIFVSNHIMIKEARHSYDFQHFTVSHIFRFFLEDERLPNIESKNEYKISDPISWISAITSKVYKWFIWNPCLLIDIYHKRWRTVALRICEIQTLSYSINTHLNQLCFCSRLWNSYQTNFINIQGPDIYISKVLYLYFSYIY